MSGDMHFTGYTHDGNDIEVYVDQETGNSYVVIETPNMVFSNFSSIKFNFNPDFPEDAKRAFEALCEVRGIEIEGLS